MALTKTTSANDVVLTGVATVSQLAQMFRTDAKTLPKRLVGVMPEAKSKAGHNLYNIREAAGRIVEPSYEIEQYIMGMNHTQLPAMLGKEFWNAQIARIKFEETIGRLYSLEKVVQALSELYSTVRMGLLLMADNVERETGLNETQRNIIKAAIDGTIDEIRTQVVERFKDYGNGPGDDGTLFLTLADLESAGADGTISPAPEDEEDDDGI